MLQLDFDFDTRPTRAEFDLSRAPVDISDPPLDSRGRVAIPATGRVVFDPTGRNVETNPSLNIQRFEGLAFMEFSLLGETIRLDGPTNPILPSIYTVNAPTASGLIAASGNFDGVYFFTTVRSDTATSRITQNL